MHLIGFIIRIVQNYLCQEFSLRMVQYAPKHVGQI